MMIIKNLTPAEVTHFRTLTGQARAAAQRRLEVHILEIGYTSLTRLDDLFAEKAQQHAGLVKELTQAGWRVVYPKEHIVALGTAGHVRREM